MNTHYRQYPKLLLKSETSNLNQLKASSNYTLLMYKDGRKVISAYCLKIFEELLDQTKFMRINRSTIINTAFVESYELEKGTIRLLNNTLIKIPRRRAVQLKGEYPEIFKST